MELPRCNKGRSVSARCGICRRNGWLRDTKSGAKTMFITPPEKTYTYSTGWKVIAWMPLVAVGLIAAAGVAPDFQDLLLPGWIIALGATAALSVFWWLYLSRSSISVHSEGITRSGLFGTKDIPRAQTQNTPYAQTTTS